MRSFLIKSSLLTGFIVLFLITSGIAMAVIAPFQPGNILFPLQYFVEQKAMVIHTDPISKSNYSMDLLERRINDLVARTGSKYELIALDYLNKAIDQVTLSISLVSQTEGGNQRLRLLYLVKLTEDKLKLLSNLPLENQTIFQAFLTKIQTLLLMVETANVPNSELNRITGIPIINQGLNHEPGTTVMVTGSLIPFPPGSPGAVHAFYPLVGLHILLTCNRCHISGKYVGTPKTCTLCHILIRPAPHYGGDCSLCHSAISWEDIHFDHDGRGAADCRSCHEG